MSKKYSLLLPSFTAGIFLPLLVASVAQAHVGTHQTSGFLHGFQHPLGGLDHILAMLAVGLWAAQLGHRAVWALPVTFMGVMLVGGTIGMTTSFTLPGVEPAILVSDLVLGGLILATIRLPITISVSLVGMMAIFHGYAHGAEMPAQAAGLEYAAGFVCATALLHLFGLGTALLVQKYRQAQLVQFAGASILLGSIVLITKFALGS
jgi:urease accessory protein